MYSDPSPRISCFIRSSLLCIFLVSGKYNALSDSSAGRCYSPSISSSSNHPNRSPVSSVSLHSRANASSQTHKSQTLFETSTRDRPTVLFAFLLYVYFYFYHESRSLNIRLQTTPTRSPPCVRETPETSQKSTFCGALLNSFR